MSIHLVLIVTLLCGAPMVASALAVQGVVIERTLAIVAGHVVTLSDVRTAVALGLIDLPAGRDEVEAGAERLVERALMLLEVERYLPAEPLPGEVDARFDEIRARFETPLDFARALDAGGFSTARLRAWIRDDLRIAAYLAQRFATGGVPTDQEIGAYYAAHREEFERSGVPFEEIVPLIRERLSGERRRELIADWVDGLRRRTDVVEMYRQGGV